MYLCGSAHSKQVRVRLTSENKLRRDSKKEMSGNQARPEKEANPLELAIDGQRLKSAQVVLLQAPTCVFATCGR